MRAWVMAMWPMPMQIPHIAYQREHALDAVLSLVSCVTPVSESVSALAIAHVEVCLSQSVCMLSVCMLSLFMCCLSAYCHETSSAAHTYH